MKTVSLVYSITLGILLAQLIIMISLSFPTPFNIIVTGIFIFALIIILIKSGGILNATRKKDN